VSALPSVDELFDGVRLRDRTSLAKAITLVESTRADHREHAGDLLSRLQAFLSTKTIRLGLSGTPGVGKSTVIESLGTYLTDQLELQVAVLAVDPSSRRTGGSILGDKTRMAHLSRSDRAFIRPSPSAGTLGGVARRTRDVMMLCEAAAFDVIVVETVGVGQSETTVASMTDLFVLLVAPAGGDELQGVKRGVMELADLLVVNKCDGDLRSQALATLADYTAALRLTRSAQMSDGVRSCAISGRTGEGIIDLWTLITQTHQQMRAGGALSSRRAEQRRAWMWDEVTERVLEAFRHDAGVAALATQLEGDVVSGRMLAGEAADRLLATWLPPRG
jgi:LAO/AO transport system kinase